MGVSQLIHINNLNELINKILNDEILSFADMNSFLLQVVKILNVVDFNLGFVNKQLRENRDYIEDELNKWGFSF